jgi:hypothetical protein
LVNFSFSVQKLFNIDAIQFVDFWSYFLSVGPIEKFVAYANILKFSSISFKVSGLTLSSLIHFELIFLQREIGI